MAGSEEDLGGGATEEADTQVGGTTGFNPDVGDTGDMGGGGGEVGLGVSGAQTGSVSAGSESGSTDDSGVAKDFEKADTLQSGEEAHEDFLPPPTIAEFDEQAKGDQSS
jgi:hypothetical protein